MTGGVIGIIIGWGGSQIITATGLLHDARDAGSRSALGVGVCAAIGIVFGYYPARAARQARPDRGAALPVANGLR